MVAARWAPDMEMGVDHAGAPGTGADAGSSPAVRSRCQKLAPIEWRRWARVSSHCRIVWAPANTRSTDG